MDCSSRNNKSILSKKEHNYEIVGCFGKTFDLERITQKMILQHLQKDVFNL